MEEQEFSRYREMLTSLAGPALRGVAVCDVQPDAVTLGVPAARLLMEDDPDLYAPLCTGFETLARLGVAEAPMLADSFGHRRDVYHLLVLHLHLAAFAKHYELMSVAQWSACEDLLPAATESCRHVERYASDPPPGDDLAATLWRVLCVFETARIQSRDTDIEWVDAVVHQVVNRRGNDGAMHPVEDDESYDLWTYRELSGLHALANLALLRRSESWATRVREIAEHHQRATQPDYTTSQPWGVFGFAWSASTRPFADQQVHDAQTEGGGGLTPLAAMLLADAVHALGAFGG